MTLPWSLPIFIAAVVVLSLVYQFGPRLFPGSLLVWRSFWCPFRREHVGVDFRESVWEGRRDNVERCTAFSPAEAVSCDKACLAIKTLPTSDPGSAQGLSWAGVCSCWQAGLPRGLGGRSTLRER